MILYHPVHDPFHAAFRLLRLLIATESQSIELLKLRILDYYLIFPAEIEGIQMPSNIRTWKIAFRSHRNKYFSTVSKHVVFRQLTGAQEMGVRLVASRNLIETSHVNGIQSISARMGVLPPQLLASLTRANANEDQLVQFLSVHLAGLDLTDLKRRTGLAEYRYDIA